jgi:hypothetical protein
LLNGPLSQVALWRKICAAVLKNFSGISQDFLAARLYQIPMRLGSPSLEDARFCSAVAAAEQQADRLDFHVFRHESLLVVKDCWEIRLERILKPRKQ